MTDKKPQTCYVFINASDRLPLITKKWYACNVINNISGNVSGTMVYCAEDNWDSPYPLEVVEFLESIPNVFIFTQEELEEKKMEWMREAAEKAWNAANRHYRFDKDSEGNPIPNKQTHLDQHYPKPQPFNTNL